MKHADELTALLRADPERRRLIALVRTLELPDCWIAAGFVRNAVWDWLHDRPPSPLSGDVDVIWFAPCGNGAENDRQLEHRLLELDSSIAWSVKNQSRMHVRNGDAPYLCSSDAMRYWPETATAVAVRCGSHGNLELAAPFGLHDLYQAIVRPTTRFSEEKRNLFDQRLRDKRWLLHWPLLRVEENPEPRAQSLPDEIR
ncbi:nucleotidyltransferase family protein [Collimonas sp.]|jgi:hypothetical protein|uniref:nucleotidyltransferase family protein n=1 Tax=Collimonas sp. TaxID=1963772 RepID=UPI002CC5EAB6|nr:nucleotidyltransferase family protein [Collimonas sp.]HWX01614.1 nucleotidyltransferase family protein [Collimonas sp.]